MPKLAVSPKPSAARGEKKADVFIRSNKKKVRSQAPVKPSRGCFKTVTKQSLLKIFSRVSS
ncbi:hypothetical protein B1R32_11177 [Abditibacterium utsteinense]|uniref:Uncharacterized protein n=1 Tax=Abditibacterium utsteinense TaxID=1960156 RepID=A0A2S8SRW4_9BACT|nr:hypothetical protein B1R32_11177 [Abditibacterium utsteinense]